MFLTIGRVKLVRLEESAAILIAQNKYPGDLKISTENQ